MISIDTDVMRQLVQTATNANNAIDDAVEVLNQITVHNDWACKERKAINDYTIKNKKLIKDLQENAAGFLNILTSVASEFDGAEKTIIDLFQNIESVLAGVLGSAVWGNISADGNHNPSSSVGDILNQWTTPSVGDILPSIFPNNVIMDPDGEIIAVPINSLPNPYSEGNLTDVFVNVIGGPDASPYNMFEFNNLFDSIHICDGALDLVPAALDFGELHRVATAALL